MDGGVTTGSHRELSADESNSSAEFQIIVPAFNEEKTLHQILSYAKAHGYLQYLVVVDDASTDSSPEILRRWASEENLNAILLQDNRKKEGAIRAAMEVLERERRLAPFTVILDADSMIAEGADGKAIGAHIVLAIDYMKSKGLFALALRIDPVFDKRDGIIARSALADYAGVQFDQWLVGRQQKLWVVNGPGGLFETTSLLRILKSIVPDFETGDLLITVELMKQQKAIEYYPHLTVKTIVPVTLRSFFRQRCRWERGTTKVLWNDRRFYLKILTSPSWMALATVLHFGLYLGVAALVVMLVLDALTLYEFVRMSLISVLAWYGVSVLKGIWLKVQRPDFPFADYCVSATTNVAVWTAVTATARFTGFAQAIVHLCTRKDRESTRAALDNAEAHDGAGRI